jgi:hypothetical protein
MGKKEKDIKRQNDDFYKEYNYVIDEKKEHLVEDEKQKVINHNHQLDNNFETMVSNIKLRMLEYVDHQGLPICQTLEDLNLENYITYVLNGCPRVISIQVDDEPEQKEAPISPCTNDEYRAILNDVDCIQRDIDISLQDIVTNLGEYDIFTEYIKSNYPDNPDKILEKNLLFPILKKRLIKLSGGVEKYNNWVNRVGLYEYRKIKQTMKL